MYWWLKKKLLVTGPVQFKSVLFKAQDQLYFSEDFRRYDHEEHRKQWSERHPHNYPLETTIS